MESTINLASKEARSKVEEPDYYALAGVDWPSYRDFLNGAMSDNPQIQTEIDHLINHQNQKNTTRFIRKVVQQNG